MPKIFLVVCLCLPLTVNAEDKSVEPQFELREKVTYATIGDRELLLDAFVPKSGGTCPAVLVVHGGAWKQGNRYQLREYATSLAKRGFVCFAIDYRLAPDHKFPAQIEDCRTAVKWIRQHAAEYEVDPNRLGAIGYSAGGHLVTLLGATGEAPSAENGNIDTRLQAVVAGGAPTDFRWFPDKGKWAEYWMGGDLDSVPERFKAASTTAFIDKDDPPMFFFNGTADGLVPLIWTLPCHAALKTVGVKTVIHKIEGADHMKAARDVEALTRAYEFLKLELDP